MSRSKKLSLWLAGGFGILVIILTALAVLLPKVIRLDSIKEMILTEIDGATGCRAGCRNLDILFFPRPHVVVHNASLSVPGKYSGTIASIRAYPRLMSLLRGKVQLGRLYLENPRIDIVIPDDVAHGEEQSQKEVSSPQDLGQRLALLFAPVVSKVPGLVVIISKGSFKLSGENDHLFSFTNLNGRIDLPPETLKVKFTCESSLWENVTLSGWLDPLKLSTGGRIILSEFKPGPLARYLLPAASRTIGESHLNLDITFKGEGPGNLETAFHGSIPSLGLRGGDQEFVIRCQAIEGAFKLNAGQMEVALSRLLLNYPQLSLNGKFFVDSKTDAAALEIESRETDADAVRSIALAVLGRYHTVRQIFEIIQGGRVPLITYSASAPTPSELGKSEYFVLKGSMADGKILVPKIQLEVNGARGEVIVANGILEGKNLEGQTTAGSIGREGILKIGLVQRPGEDKPFHLDIDIDANLVELQPVLGRVVTHGPFLRELSLVKDVKGRARGRLLLGETLSDVKTVVDVRQFELSGRYERLPQPVDLKGGPFLYKATSVAVGPMDGMMGKSRFPGISFQVDWGPQSELNVSTSTRSSIVLDEVFPWLMLHDSVKKPLEKIRSARGVLIVDSLDIKGPLWSRERHIRARGAVTDLVAQVEDLPASVTVKRGRFDAGRDKLALEDLQTVFLDSSLLISGNLDGYRQGAEGSDLNIQGTVEPQAAQWVFDLIHLPAGFRPRPPVSLTRSRFGHDKKGNISFSADLTTVQPGPKVSIDVRRTPEELSISHLTIRDEDSDATLSIDIQERELDLGFTGVLSKASLDNLLDKNQILAGWIKGNFRSHIFLDRPMDSTASGELQAAGFRYTWKLLDGPITVEDAYLSAGGNRLNVKSAALNWQNSRMTLKGNVDFSTTGFNVDMDLAADKLDWEQLKQGKEKDSESKGTILHKTNAPQSQETKNGSSAKDSKLGDSRLQGVLRVRSESFSYGKLVWTPLSASVSFKGDVLDIDLTEANLCGISTPGTIKISPEGVQLSLRPAAVNREIDPAVACLLDKKGLINGTFNLEGDVTTEQDSQHGLAKSLKGNLDFGAQKGRIYRLGLLNKIVSVLNVTEIYRGRLPDLVDEGFAFDSIKAKGTFRDGTLVLSESVLDGPSMKMAWHGDIDLTNKKMDFTVLIAPLRTVDRIIDSVPLIGSLLGGNLISIPVKVSGDLDDPEVVPLSPSAVGSELLGYFKRTFKLPFTLFEPLLQ